MRAYQITDYDSPPTLREVDQPRPEKGEIGVQIAACGLNFADLLIAKGTYQERPALPTTLGVELAGTVTEVGPDVASLCPGDRVVVYAGSGGLADYGCFPEARCIRLPDAMPLDHAAAFLVAYGTSHLALARRARMQPGETLLVLGAAGGVGLTAVEIGRLMGARVIACARGADRLKIAQDAGADHLIDSDTTDLREAVKALGGADVVYDPVGGDQFRAAFRACRPEARIITLGFASGDVPQIPANHMMVKNISVEGLNWGAYARFAPQVMADSITTLLGWYAEGRLRPHIGHSLPLDQADEALALLRERRATGKIVVTMG